jgi:serine/threonine-protein kinase OSR1/STK39
MEYLDGGSVSDILRWGYPKGFSDEVVIATILHGLVTFLSYFHERKQLHRAICPNNVLLNMQGEVKIGDLGSATGMIRAGQRYRACFTVMESPYSAPEGMVEGRGYTEKSDIWSVGITAITMATGQTPFASMKPLEQMQAIISGPSPELPAMGYSSHFRDFVRHCLQRDADKRPSAANLLKHPFMKKAKGPEFIVAAVMVKLPSLPQRFESGRADERPIEKVVKPPLISFDFDFDGKEVPIPEKVAPVVQHIQESPKQIGRFKVTVLNQRVEQQEVTTPVDVVASNVKVLSNEAKTLEDEGLEIAELLRQTQEDIHTLTNRRSKE